MAVGRFTGYQPLPDMPGAYSFQTNGGPPLTFGGPEAERIKARLDAANAQTRTAGIDSVGGYGTENQPPSPEQIQSFRDALTPKPAAAAQPAPAAPAQPGGELGYGMFVSPDGRIMRRRTVAGTPGVTTEQLKKADEGAVAMRRGETDVVQQGTPQDQNYLDARAEMNVDQRLLNQEQGDAAVAAADAESQVAAEQFAQAQRLQAEEAARIADLERKYAIEEQAKNKAFADYTSSKVDPKRVYANPIAGLARVIASSLGAHAAVMGKSPNFAQQILDQTMDRDIAAQEAAIKLKGEKANNLLSDLRQRGMSIEQSRAVARGIQVQHAAAQLAAVRAKNAVPALENQYKNIDLALQKSLMEANEANRLASVDKVTRQTSKGFEQPRAGSRGGVIVEEMPDQLAAAGKLQGLQKTEAEIAKDRAAAAKGPSASPEKRKALAVLAEGARLQNGLSKLPDDAVIVAPQEGGPIDRTGAALGDFFGGKGGGARLMRTEQERRQMADLAAAQEWIKAQRSVLSGQGALDEATSKRADAAIAPGATAGEIKRALADVYSAGQSANVAADEAGEAGGIVVNR